MKRSPLLLLLLVSLVLYHVGNLPWRGNLHRPWVVWSALGISDAPSKPSVSVSIRVPSIKSHQWLDSASHTLARYGSLARYLFSQYPLMAMTLIHQGRLRMVNREQTTVQFPNALPPGLFGDHIPQIRKHLKEFETKGVRCLALIVPTELLVERELWPRRLPISDYWKEVPDRGIEDGPRTYREVIAALEPWSFDLYSPFRESFLKAPDQLIYKVADYHWSSYGIALAVKEVAQRILPRDVRSLEIVEAPPIPSTYAPWFMRMLDLPAAFLEWNPAFQWTEPLFDVVAHLNQPWKPPFQVVVAGTSYMVARSDKHSFSEVLSRTLGTPVHTTSTPGGSPDKVFQALARSLVRLGKNDVLIFEQPLDLMAEGSVE